MAIENGRERVSSLAHEFHPHAANSIANFARFVERPTITAQGTTRGAKLSEAFDLLVLSGASDPNAPIRGAFGLEQIKRRAISAVLEGRPVEISILWEPHAERAEANRTDRRTAAMLNRLFKNIPAGFDPILSAELKDIRPNITLLLADVYATDHRRDNSAYLRSIQSVFKASAEAEGHGFKSIWLGEVYNQMHRGRPISSVPISDQTKDFLARRESIRDNLFTGARRRGLCLEAAERYAQNLIEGRDVLNVILGRDSLLVAIGDPIYGPLFDGVQSGVLWTRAASESGRKLSLRAPWSIA